MNGIRLQHLRFGAPRIPDLFVGGSEKNQLGGAERGCHVGRSGVVSDEQRRIPQQPSDLGQRLAAQGSPDLKTRQIFAGAADDNGFEPQILAEMAGQFQIKSRGPGLLRRGGGGMNHHIRFRRRTSGPAGRGVHAGAWHLLHGNTKIKDSGRLVLGGMDSPRNAEDFLRGGNRRVVNPARAEDVESRAEARSGKQRQTRAARAAMQIQTQDRRKLTQGSRGRRKHAGDIRIAFEYRREPGFRHNSDLEIRTGLFQQMNRGGGEHAIAQRAQPDKSNPAACGESLNGVGLRGQAAPLFVDGGLVNQHDGDLVPDRVEAMAGHAPQTTRIGLQFHFGAAGGTDKDFEEV